MALTVSRETVSFTVEHEDPLIELALAVVELSKRWGYRGEKSSLSLALNRVLSSASQDPKVTPQELSFLFEQSQQIELMEELAGSFRATLEGSDAALPRFQGELDEALEHAQHYASSLGAKLSPNY